VHSSRLQCLHYGIVLFRQFQLLYFAKQDKLTHYHYYLVEMASCVAPVSWTRAHGHLGLVAIGTLSP